MRVSVSGTAGRWWPVLVGGLCAMVGLTALSASVRCWSNAPAGESSAVTGEELRLRRLAIVDDTGSERAILESSKEGGTRLVFWGEDGSVGATIGVEPAGPRVCLGDAHDRPMAELGLGGSGDSTIAALILRDTQGRRRAGVTVSPAGTAGIVMYDESGAVHSEWEVRRDGASYLMLGDGAVMPRVMAATTAGGDSVLALYDKNGSRASMELDAAGEGGIALLGPNGEEIWNQRAP